MKPENKFIKKISSPINFWFFSVTRLPSLVFWGVRINKLSEEICTIQTRYNHRNTNPFKSMYFAALCGSGELATGLLVMAHTSTQGSWSMLVTSFESHFHKKATGKILFTCDQGEMLKASLQEIAQSADRKGSLVLTSIATNEQGETVAEFHITWSLKAR